ncbi:MAG TPA: carboxypeptidase-like regulatory domain-containing protein, partial [Pirellulales bacterium]|nr:carboxypeptidase-like regulatory domain-containing protein [Pirellulales bacterium]
ENHHYLTGRDGTVEIKLPKLVEDVRLWARQEGHVPMFAIWWPKYDPDLVAMPEEFTYRLKSGTTIGGIVTNEVGEPLDGVKVEISYQGTDFRKSGGRAVFDNWLAFGDGAVRTDLEGRWQLKNVPPGDDIDIRLRLSHPKYIGDDEWGRLQKEQHVTLESLRDETAMIAMPRGSVVSGKVTDPEGNPLKDAVVIWGDWPYREPGSQEVRTDAQGGYRFPSLPPGPMHMTVVAEGWMPVRTKIQIPRRPLPLDFALKQGKKLQIRFVDESGKAIPRVEVSIVKWQGAESLYNLQDPEVLSTRIPRKAGFGGVYEWSWAPDSPVDFEFFRPGYAEATASIAADDSEHVVTLKDADQN